MSNYLWILNNNYYNNHIFLFAQIYNLFYILLVILLLTTLLLSNKILTFSFPHSSFYLLLIPQTISFIKLKMLLFQFQVVFCFVFWFFFVFVFLLLVFYLIFMPCHFFFGVFSICIILLINGLCLSLFFSENYSINLYEWCVFLPLTIIT